jgi:hypothetical protein
MERPPPGEIVIAMCLRSRAWPDFDIKTSDRLAAVEPVIHLFILLEIGNTVDINLVPCSAMISTLSHVPDPALAENIQFLKTDRLGHIHVELGCQIRRHVESRSMLWLFGYQDAACMDASGWENPIDFRCESCSVISSR